MVKKHTGERTQSPLSPRPVLPLPSKLSEEGGVFVFDPGGGLGQSIKLVRRPCRSSWEGKGVATSGKPPPWHGNLLMDELRGAIPSREDFRVMRVSHHLVLARELVKAGSGLRSLRVESSKLPWLESSSSSGCVLSGLGREMSESGGVADPAPGTVRG